MNRQYVPNKSSTLRPQYWVKDIIRWFFSRVWSRPRMHWDTGRQPFEVQPATFPLCGSLLHCKYSCTAQFTLDRFDQVHIVTLLHYCSEPLHNLVDVLNFARNSALVDSSTTKRWTTWSQLVCVWELLPFRVLYYDCLPLMKFATCASTCAFATIYQFC